MSNIKAYSIMSREHWWQFAGTGPMTLISSDALEHEI